MKLFFWVILMIAGLFLDGCVSYEPVFHEDGDWANYEKIFGTKLPSGIKVLNSCYVTYSGFNTVTPDWEIELVANKEWIDDKVNKFDLKLCTEKNSYVYKSIAKRCQKSKKWYAPKEISNYDCYYLYITSIPYVHMLVEKIPLKNNEFRVFMSKH